MLMPLGLCLGNRRRRRLNVLDRRNTSRMRGGARAMRTILRCRQDSIHRNRNTNRRITSGVDEPDEKHEKNKRKSLTWFFGGVVGLEEARSTDAERCELQC